MTRMPSVVGLIAVGAYAALPLPTLAQLYPVKPIRVVVGFQAGGGVDMYKGSAPSVIGLLSGEVQILFSSIPAALSQIRAGMSV